MHRTLIVSALVAAALGTAACSDNSGAPNDNNTNIAAASVRNVNESASPTPSGSLNSEDKTFVTEAAIGGMAEVQLGQLAMKNAKNADVKNFGQHMVDDHSKANNDLKQLATSKGITLPTDLDAKHKEAMERLSKLTGDAFDKAYMADMVEDHTKDVSDFQKQSNSTGDKDIRAFAAKTLPVLQSHLEMAKSVNTKAQKGK